MMNRRIAVIPAYEPDDKLLSLLGKIRKCGFEAVVVDVVGVVDVVLDIKINYYSNRQRRKL